MRYRVFTIISLIALVAALAAAPSAMAQTSPVGNISPAEDVYNPNSDILNVIQGDSICREADGLDANGNRVTYGSAADCEPGTPPEITRGELPFTGFEAGMVALAGLALLGAGFAVRRAARDDTA